jgi:hypothetical protein
MKSAVAIYALLLTAIALCASITVYAQDDGIDDKKTIKIFSYPLKGESAAKAYLADIRQLAATTPYSPQIMVSVSRQLLAWGWKPEETKNIIRACANAAAGVDSDDSKFTQIALLVGRLTDEKQPPYIAFSGLEDLGIPAWQMIARPLGKSVDQTKRYTLGNELSTKRAFEALIAGFNETYGGAAEREARKLKGGIPERPTLAPPAPSSPPSVVKDAKKMCFFGGQMIPCSKN